jgi:hypothetical protein
MRVNSSSSDHGGHLIVRLVRTLLWDPKQGGNYEAPTLRHHDRGQISYDFHPRTSVVAIVSASL